MSIMDFQGPGFKMKVPTDWFITSSPQFQVMFVAPPNQDLRANLMITIRPLEENVTLDSVIESSLKIQEKEYPAFKIREDGEFKIGDLAGYQRLYEWFSNEHKMKIVQRQVIFVAGRVLTTITTTRTEVGAVENLDSMFDLMLRSFQFQ